METCSNWVVIGCSNNISRFCSVSAAADPHLDKNQTKQVTWTRRSSVSCSAWCRCGDDTGLYSAWTTPRWADFVRCSCQRGCFRPLQDITALFLTFTSKRLPFIKVSFIKERWMNAEFYNSDEEVWQRGGVRDLWHVAVRAKFSSDTHLGNGQVNLMVSTSLGEMDGVISPEPLY